MGKTYRTTAPTKQGPTFTVEGTLLEFTDEGEVLDSGEEWSETFRCLPTASGGALDDLVSAVSVNDRGEVEFSRVSVLRFVRELLIPADVVRFEQMVRDKRRLIELDVLGAIMMDLAQEVTGQRPTGPQRTSPSSSAGTENGSTPSSSSSDGPPTSPTPEWTLPQSFT